MAAVDPDTLAVEIERLRRGILTMPPYTNRKEQVLKANAMKLLGSKIEEREMELERRRVEEVVRQHEELHPPTLGECPICLETVRLDIVSNVARFSCCGNYTCLSCYELDKIAKCPLCRAHIRYTEQDNVDAIERLAENGSAWAMCGMGEMYEEGKHGLKMDRRKAFEWFRRAAEEGSANAMYKVGDKLLSGEEGIVAKSTGEGVRWLKSATEKSQINAQAALGLRYLEGNFVAKDLVEAVRLLTLTVSRDSGLAETGAATVCFFLGRCFMDGAGGLEKSLERAQFYLMKATSLPTFGTAQLVLARVLLQLNNERYDSRITIPGHSCIPQVLNLLRRALENGETGAASTIDSLERLRCNDCASCQRGAVEILPLTLKSCTRCKAVWYCGKECQREDWKDGHKVDCAKVGK